MRSKIKKRLIHIAIFLFLVFVGFRRLTQEKNYEIFLPNQDPKVVWSFLADFSNVVKLNERIVSWQLLDDDIARGEGVARVWSYKVVSYEGMMGDSIWGVNENHGEITVEEIDREGPYQIRERYKTLSLRKWITINNWTRMDFKKVKINGQIGTLFQENVKMNCPLIFAYICSLETDRNREIFFSNLKVALS